jgi:hypothetical protein
MPTASQRRRDRQIRAVIRSYQPSRIERELLAQVYDLAQHGIQDRSADFGEQPTVVDRAADRLAVEPAQHQILVRYARPQVDELEAVA